MSSPAERPDRIWDSGLQPERTSLAWQRVNLAGLGASLVSARLVVEAHPVIGYTLAALSAVIAGVVTVLHSRRLVRTISALFSGALLPDGRVHVLLVGLLVLIAAGGLVFLTGATG
ncbi:MAG: DUF202 domain-containing protein [Micropruina sp.]|uniref:DUF202 domain-containing protein n=1 Tax=Micropruina sp. TaxID=2737536 RepID=UPI0039E603EB